MRTHSFDTGVCPKCGYRRGRTDAHVHPGICPSCGIAYLKYLERATDTPFAEDSVGRRRPRRSPRAEALWPRLIDTVTAVPERVDATSFWGRIGLYALFFVWGWSFILGGIDWESIGGSFLHNANLPFHEFGHVLFAPFGRFLAILGGSLFQVLMPLGLMLAFIIARRDNFAASVMLWWSGQNFIDVSPYIADARYREIPLIRGIDESHHDWGNLLTMTDALGQAESLARLAFGCGVALMLLSFLWGAWLLVRQRRLMGG